MSNLVKKYLGHDDEKSCYRKIGSGAKEQTLACGYLKKTSKNSNMNMALNYYGGLFLIKGEGYYSDNMESHKISAGDFVQRLPNLKHSTIVYDESEWLEFFICINTSSYNNLFEMGLMSHAPVLKGKVPQDIIDYFPIFLQKMQDAKEDELLTVFFEAQELLCKITKCCAEEHMNGEIVNECIKLLNSSYGRISGNELAEKLCVSYESLRKKFKRSMGISIAKYGILIRISKAKQLLENTDYKIEQIAHICNYPDQFSFSKQFKQYTYLSPTEYRETF